MQTDNEAFQSSSGGVDCSADLHAPTTRSSLTTEDLARTSMTAAASKLPPAPHLGLTAATSTTPPLLATRQPTPATGNGASTPIVLTYSPHGSSAAGVLQGLHDQPTKFFACGLCGKCFISLKYLDMHTALHLSQQQQQQQQLSPTLPTACVSTKPSPAHSNSSAEHKHQAISPGQIIISPPPPLKPLTGPRIHQRSETTLHESPGPPPSLRAAPKTVAPRPAEFNLPVQVAAASAAGTFTATTPPPPAQRSAPRDREWRCDICHKTFSQNSSYKNHQRTHSDERPFVCTVCSIGFKERYHLKKHMLFKHSDEAREQCRVCGKRFKDSTAVRAHERIHSESRPYSCHRCQKAFKTSECLWHHENRSKSCGGGRAPAGSDDMAAAVENRRRGGGGRRRVRRETTTMTTDGAGASPLGCPPTPVPTPMKSAVVATTSPVTLRNLSSFQTAVVSTDSSAAAAAAAAVLSAIGYQSTPLSAVKFEQQQRCVPEKLDSKLAAALLHSAFPSSFLARSTSHQVAQSKPRSPTSTAHVPTLILPHNVVSFPSSSTPIQTAEAVDATLSAHRAGLVLLANCAVRGPLDDITSMTSPPSSVTSPTTTTTTTTQVKVEPEMMVVPDFELTSMSSLEASFYERIRMAAGEASMAAGRSAATLTLTVEDGSSKGSSASSGVAGGRRASSSTDSTLTDTEMMLLRDAGATGVSQQGQLTAETGWKSDLEYGSGSGSAGGDSRRLDCVHCGKLFSTIPAFEKHALVHSEQRPYRCDVCGVGFKLKVHLKKHNLYRHSDDYRCECRHCGKRFKDSSAVRLHERIHSTDRPFPCFSCGKTFKTRENLWGHTHRGPCGLQQAAAAAAGTELGGLQAFQQQELYNKDLIEAARSPPAMEESVVLDDMVVAGHEVVGTAVDNETETEESKFTFDNITDGRSSPTAVSVRDLSRQGSHITLLQSDPTVAFFNPFHSVLLSGIDASDLCRVTNGADPEDAEERSRMAAISLQQATTLLLQSCRMLQDGRSILFQSATTSGGGTAAIYQPVPTAVVAPIKREAVQPMASIQTGHGPAAQFVSIAAETAAQQQSSSASTSPISAAKSLHLPPFETFRAHAPNGSGSNTSGQGLVERNNNAGAVNLSLNAPSDEVHWSGSGDGGGMKNAMTVVTPVPATVTLMAATPHDLPPSQQQDRLVIWYNAEETGSGSLLGNRVVPTQILSETRHNISNCPIYSIAEN